MTTARTQNEAALRAAIGYAPVPLSIRDHPEITSEYRTAKDADGLVERILGAGFTLGEKGQQILMAERWDQFQIVVNGSAPSIDVLKNILVPDSAIRSIRIFDIDSNEYVLKLNYTALKEARK